MFKSLRAIVITPALINAKGIKYFISRTKSARKIIEANVVNNNVVPVMDLLYHGSEEK